MSPNRFDSSDLEIKADAAEVYLGFQPGYQETLVAPMDDMWAAFADLATPYALRLRGETVGCCSVNEDRELLSFHVNAQAEDVAETIFGELIQRLELVATLPSTVDPNFLSLSLDVGHGSESKALLYHHLLEPEGTTTTLPDLRLATLEDHPVAIAFCEAATGMPKSFLEPYLAERIEKGELLLHEQNGEIIASGECRTDQRQSGYAHLGIIVGRSQRGQGLGRRLMHALVLESRRRQLVPLCSTEPENLAARGAIHKAGFRARHRVLRVTLGQGGH